MRLEGQYLTILLLIRSYDTEINPGPKKQSSLKFFHWNLSGLAPHDFFKLPLMEAYITTKIFDILSLSKTVLDSSISNYSLYRAHHPSNSNNGGVCIYYKIFFSQ